MIARVSLVVTAVLALGWLGVLLRDELVGSAATRRVFYNPALSRADLDRQFDRLKGAELLNPDPKWQRTRAALLLLRGRPREAARAAEAIVRAEPADIEAWGTLQRATERIDPRRSAEARAAIIRLNPRGARPPR